MPTAFIFFGCPAISGIASPHLSRKRLFTAVYWPLEGLSETPNNFLVCVGTDAFVRPEGLRLEFSADGVNVKSSLF